MEAQPREKMIQRMRQQEAEQHTTKVCPRHDVGQAAILLAKPEPADDYTSAVTAEGREEREGEVCLNVCMYLCTAGEGVILW